MTIILFILVLGLLVLVHEFGHFYAAKKAGCYVEEFAIGFPPRLFKIQGKETVYTINALPIGGFVKIRGEDGALPDDPKSFASKSFWQKSAIILAGVGMNIALAYVFITAVLAIGIPTIVTEEVKFPSVATISDRQVQIVSVLPDSPASRVGLEPGDVLLSIDETVIQEIGEVKTAFTQIEPEETLIEYRRGEELATTRVVPENLEDIEGTGIGIALTETAMVSYPWYIAPFYGIERTLAMLWLIISAFAGLIAQLFTTGGVSADIAGPIGIAVLTGEVAKLGLVHLLQFTAVLSLNLAIINVLPFPALDGSRFVLIVLEKIRGKKLNSVFEHWVNILGFGFLMLLMVFVTAKDLSTYGGSLFEAITSVFG